jgi:hypothetical protein
MEEKPLALVGKLTSLKLMLNLASFKNFTRGVYRSIE